MRAETSWQWAVLGGRLLVSGRGRFPAAAWVRETLAAFLMTLRLVQPPPPVGGPTERGPQQAR